MLTAKDIGWIAGILEGEGYFSLQNNSTPIVVLSMTDLDVVQRVASIVGGNVLTLRKIGDNKQVYRLSMIGRYGIGVMMTIYSFMGNRRKEKIREILKVWKNVPTRLTHIKDGKCRQGHIIDAQNMVIQNMKGLPRIFCRICTNSSKRAYKARKRLHEIGEINNGRGRDLAL